MPLVFLSLYYRSACLNTYSTHRYHSETTRHQDTWRGSREHREPADGIRGAAVTCDGFRVWGLGYWA
jgi:hypothetical protein